MQHIVVGSEEDAKICHRVFKSGNDGGRATFFAADDDPRPQAFGGGPFRVCGVLSGVASELCGTKEAYPRNPRKTFWAAS